MPFTPFHFGPAAVLKAVAPRHFSFGIFCFAQVVTDAEVLVHMARGGEALHQHFHTYLGATGAGLVSWLAGRPVCGAALRWWRKTDGLPLKEYYDPPPKITPLAAISGAFIGTYSHVFLDSLIYAEMTPLAPFSLANPVFGLIGPGALHGLCFVSGILGAWLCARLPKEP